MKYPLIKRRKWEKNRTTELIRVKKSTKKKLEEIKKKSDLETMDEIINSFIKN